MTNRDFFSAVATGTLTDEVVAFAQKHLSDMDAKTSADKAKRDADNAPLLAQVRDILSDGRTHTASDIAARMNISASKATALAKKIDGIKVDAVTVDKRVVNGYHI